MDETAACSAEYRLVINRENNNTVTLLQTRMQTGDPWIDVPVTNWEDTKPELDSLLQQRPPDETEWIGISAADVEQLRQKRRRCW